MFADSIGAMGASVDVAQRLSGAAPSDTDAATTRKRPATDDWDDDVAYEARKEARQVPTKVVETVTKVCSTVNVRAVCVYVCVWVWVGGGRMCV